MFSFYFLSSDFLVLFTCSVLELLSSWMSLGTLQSLDLLTTGEECRGRLASPTRGFATPNRMPATDISTFLLNAKDYRGTSGCCFDGWHLSQYFSGERWEGEGERSITYYHVVSWSCQWPQDPVSAWTETRTDVTPTLPARDATARHVPSASDGPQQGEPYFGPIPLPLLACL